MGGEDVGRYPEQMHALDVDVHREVNEEADTQGQNQIHGPVRRKRAGISPEKRIMYYEWMLLANSIYYASCLQKRFTRIYLTNNIEVHFSLTEALGALSLLLQV